MARSLEPAAEARCARGHPPEHDAIHADGPLPVLQGGLAGQVHKLLRADHMLIVLWREHSRDGSARPSVTHLSCLTVGQSPAGGRVRGGQQPQARSQSDISDPTSDNGRWGKRTIQATQDVAVLHGGWGGGLASCCQRLSPSPGREPRETDGAPEPGRAEVTTPLRKTGLSPSRWELANPLMRDFLH